MNIFEVDLLQGTLVLTKHSLRGLGFNSPYFSVLEDT